MTSNIVAEAAKARRASYADLDVEIARRGSSYSVDSSGRCISVFRVLRLNLDLYASYSVGVIGSDPPATPPSECAREDP